jgi:hypothetical protein
MDGSLRLPPLARLLALNTEISEMRTELMRQPVASVRIAELQEEIDRNSRSSLATCWLTGGYELEPDDDDWEGDWEDGMASAD